MPDRTPDDEPQPAGTDDLPPRVQAVLDEVLARQTVVLAEVSPDCVPLVQAVRELLAGGKRLRPTFCYWGWRGGGGRGSEDDVLRAAAALELFQAAALIHDDVMDRSDTRRGQPAVHRRFASVHASRGWAGDPERFGQASAILAGDLCLSWSDEVLSGCRTAGSRLEPARAVFDRMRTQLMGGQYLDVLEQAAAASDDPVARARRVVRFKTAKYTVEHPLLLGGALAGAAPEVLASYSAYGLPLGEAFQLRDDVLGVFGDPGQTGKPAGEDLREGKRTLLVALALAAADERQAGEVRTHLGDPGLDEDGVARLQEVLLDTGALAAVEDLIADLVTQSRTALAAAPVTGPARAALADLVDACTVRTA